MLDLYDISNLQRLINCSIFDETYKCEFESQLESDLNEQEVDQLLSLLLNNQQSIRDGIYYGQTDIVKYLGHKFEKETKGFTFL